jgi:hypothetical protein
VFCSGCNIVAPAVAVASGPPKTQARYVLPDVPTVVFIDDRMSRIEPASLRRSIADRVNEKLMNNAGITTTIRPQDAMLIASRTDRAGDLMHIQDIGKAVGAEQIIYVEIAQFEESADGFTPRPVALAHIKVVDVANNQRVFPPAGTPKGWPVQVTGDAIDPALYASRSSRLQIHASLAAELGDEIAKVFYDHEYKEVGSRVGGTH